MRLNLTAIKTNVGLLDRLIRLILASVLFYLGLFVYSGSAVGIGLIVVSVLLAVTAAVGFCGLYSLLGIRTCPRNEKL
jgi:amino acid transporter